MGYLRVPWEAPKDQNEDICLMYRFFAREGCQAGPAEEPGLHTFEQRLAEGGLAHLRIPHMRRRPQG